MSGKEHWRTEKRRDISGYGKSASSKVAAYMRAWEDRCYSEGIPDCVPDEIARIGLAPSYKAIAMAILLNRYSLLGIVPQSTIWFDKPEVRPEGQISLFDEL